MRRRRVAKDAQGYRVAEVVENVADSGQAGNDADEGRRRRAVPQRAKKCMHRVRCPPFKMPELQPSIVRRQHPHQRPIDEQHLPTNLQFLKHPKTRQLLEIL